jgi:hypothetical protein
MVQVAKEAWGARAITVAVSVVPNRTRILDQPVVSNLSTDIFRRKHLYMTT